MKLANIDGIATYNGNNDNCVSFIVGTTEISIPLGNNINAEEEIAKMENEIKSAKDATVVSVAVNKGESVDTGAVLVTLG